MTLTVNLDLDDIRRLIVDAINDLYGTEAIPIYVQFKFDRDYDGNPTNLTGASVELTNLPKKAVV